MSDIGRLVVIGAGTLLLFLGRGDAVVPPRATAGVRRRASGGADRASRRPARAGERDAQPGSHGRHRRGPDDRHRAGHVRGHPRPGNARLVLRLAGTSSSAPTTWSPRRTAGRRSQARPLTRAREDARRRVPSRPIREDQARAFGEVGPRGRHRPGDRGQRAALPLAGPAPMPRCTRWATDGAIVTDKFAKEYDLAVGERFSDDHPVGQAAAPAGRRHRRPAGFQPARPGGRRASRRGCSTGASRRTTTGSSS